MKLMQWEKECHECKKTFMMPDKRQWAYRIKHKEGRSDVFCSWKCLREYKRRMMRNVVGRRFDANVWSNKDNGMEMV